MYRILSRLKTRLYRGLSVNSKMFQDFFDEPIFAHCARQNEIHFLWVSKNRKGRKRILPCLACMFYGSAKQT